LPILLRPVS